MPPDDSAPPPGDWEPPPVDTPTDELLGWTPEPALPAVPPTAEVPPPAEVDEPEASRPAYLPGGPAEPAGEPAPVLPVAPEPVLVAEPEPEAVLVAEPEPEPEAEPEPQPAALLPGGPPVALPVAAAPVAEHDPFAGIGAPLLDLAPEEPPSTGVLPVPRRSSGGGDPVSPVRALAGAAVAVAGVLLGIGALLWATDAPKGSPALQQTQAQSSDLARSPSPSLVPSPSPEATTAAPAPLQSPSAVASPAAAPKIPLTVLNNSNVNKLAARAAAKYKSRGWPIKDTGAFRGRISVTTVYYAPGQQASAALLQKEFPAIQRIHPRFAGLPGSGLTVVLTRDYPA